MEKTKVIAPWLKKWPEIRRNLALCFPLEQYSAFSNAGFEETLQNKTSVNVENQLDIQVEMITDLFTLRNGALPEPERWCLQG